MLSINPPTPRPYSPHPVLNLGFRIFFLGAGVFSMLSMLLWALVFNNIVPYQGVLLSFYWHGHEMVFGYGLAVIAGFLLTAVKTWTGQTMPYGKKLLPIFGAWAFARVAWMGLHATPSQYVLMMALVFDGLFWGLTVRAVVQAVWATRQKRQLGIVLNLLVMSGGLVLFYVGALQNHVLIQKLALYLGFYLIIAMILTIGRRVLPFFIEKGVMVGADGKPNGVSYTQKNSAVLDKMAIISLLAFVVFELIAQAGDLVNNAQVMAGISALLVALINAVRLIRWYHQGIWQKVLLWSLYLSVWGVVLGFMLMAAWGLLGAMGVSIANGHSLALHTLAVSGIGMTTLSMMARVSLGHTGRSIHQVLKGVGAMLLFIGLSLVFRVGVSLVDYDHYGLWVLMSQIMWVVSFGLFIGIYAKILTQTRVDGLFG